VFHNVTLVATVKQMKENLKVPPKYLHLIRIEDAQKTSAWLNCWGNTGAHRLLPGQPTLFINMYAKGGVLGISEGLQSKAVAISELIGWLMSPQVIKIMPLRYLSEKRCLYIISDITVSGVVSSRNCVIHSYCGREITTQSDPAKKAGV